MTQGASRDNCPGSGGIVVGEDLVWLYALFGEGGRKDILLDSIDSSVDKFCPLFQQLMRSFLQNISPLRELFRNSCCRIIHPEIWFSSPVQHPCNNPCALERAQEKHPLEAVLVKASRVPHVLVLPSHPQNYSKNMLKHHRSSF